jgi:TRAP-type C4-dicarboxylate transport system permease small subunit
MTTGKNIQRVLLQESNKMSAIFAKSKKALAAVDKVVFTLETFLVTICLGAMVVIVLAQIFMRNAMDSGFMVGDPLVKHLVLWITFIGACIASKQGVHITVDIASRLLPQKIKLPIEALVNFFSAGICAILTIGAYGFLMMEHQSHTMFGTTPIPVWILELIIPIGFAIITLRFVFKGLLNISKAINPA